MLDNCFYGKFLIFFDSIFTMHQEKISLTWHSYSDHLKSMMKQMMINRDFSDVTLVTEDKKQIKANISILSACSPVFKDILKKEKDSSILMYLRGIQHSEMESIMQFIYLGEATFCKERLDEFLAVAKSLEIKELSTADTLTSLEPEDEPSPSLPLIHTIMHQEKSPEFEELCNASTTTKNEPEDETSPSDPGPSADHGLEQPSQDKDGGVDRKYNCKQCHKIYSCWANLYRHRKFAHEGVKYACDWCDYQATTQSHLTVHIRSQHQGIKYACDQCDFQATSKTYLTVHIQSKHGGIKYACDRCDYLAPTKSHLTLHTKSKHEGIRWPCDQCDYQATTKSYLTVHVQSKHEGVMHACDQCNYQASDRSNLTKHIKRKHTVVKVVKDELKEL